MSLLLMPDLNLHKRSQEERGFMLLPNQFFWIGNVYLNVHIVPHTTAALSLRDPEVPWCSHTNSPVNCNLPVVGTRSSRGKGEGTRGVLVGSTVLTKLTGGCGKIKATVELGAELFVSLCFVLGYFPNTVTL